MASIYVDRNPNPKNKEDLLTIIEGGERPDTIEIIPSSKNKMRHVLKAVDDGYQVDNYRFNANDRAFTTLNSQGFVTNINLLDMLNNLLNQQGGRRRNMTMRKRKSLRRTNKRKQHTRRRY